MIKSKAKLRLDTTKMVPNSKMRCKLNSCIAGLDEKKSKVQLLKYMEYKNLNIMDIHSVKCATDLGDILEVNCSVYEVIEDLIKPSENLEHFFVCDLDDIVAKYIDWIKLMPRIKAFYAVKCNDNPFVLKVLSALGLGFDCASKVEIRNVLSIGVSPDRIIYAHPVKLLSHIEYASCKDVQYTTFDSRCELEKCKQFYPNARFIIRIRCDAAHAAIKFGAKFGCHPYKEAPELLHFAKALQLDVVGVAFHVGNGCTDKIAYRKAIACARYVFECGSALGYEFDLLDIGGGFPGDKNNCLNEFAKIINGAINDYFPDPNIKIVAEPGTYFVRSAFTLCCAIHGVKHDIYRDNHTKHQKSRYMYYIGDGVFHSFSRVGYKVEAMSPKLLKPKFEKELYKTIIWGQTCDALDQVVKETYMPRATLGDWVMFENMGDYSTSVSSNFNGFSAPNIYVIASKNTMLLLKHTAPALFRSSQEG